MKLDKVALTQVGIPEHIQNILDHITNHTKDMVQDVLDAQDFDAMIEYLKGNYNAFHVNNIPDSVKVLLSHPKFIVFVNEYIDQNIENVLDNDSIYSFEELSFYIFLLGFGEFYGILQDLNTYNLELLGKLFDKHIDIIIDSLHTDLFEQSLTSFINLSDLINTLCILNQVDSSRKLLIPKLVELLNQKITLLLSSLSQKGVGGEEIRNKLSYISYRSGINFSHIEYVSTKEKSPEEVVEGFYPIIMKLIDSYNGAFSTQFGNIPEKQKTIYITFLGNLGYILSILLAKLLEMGWDQHEHLIKNEKLQHILQGFYNVLGVPFDNETLTLQDVFQYCNSIFTHIYFSDENFSEIDYHKDGKNAIEDLIANQHRVNASQIESIHHLVMFLPDLSLDDLLQIGNFLVSTPKFNNYNFEFFKLKTLDLIVTKMKKGYITPEIRLFLDTLIKYIEENKIASQLLHTYSRLYLTIAYFYAFCFDETSNNQALECYSIFSKINGDEFEYERYGKDMEEFPYKIGLYRLNSILCNCAGRNDSCDVEKKGCIVNRDQAIKFGKRRLKDYKKNYEIRLKNELDKMLSEILEKALNENSISDAEINSKVSEILSSKIFHGIAETHIVEIHDDKHLIEKLRLHNGIGSSTVDLFNGYKLLFTYPKIYEVKFQQLYKDETEYILINIKNIITSYLKRRDSFIDHKTGLSNEAKLKLLLTVQKQDVSFISIKLRTLRSINDGHGYNAGDEYMRQVAEGLYQIPDISGNVFRLSGAKFGILVSDDEKIPAIIDIIRNIKINLDGVIFNLDAYIGVVTRESDRIIERADTAMSEAKRLGKDMMHYSQNLDKINQSKRDLNYLAKLDKALEEGRVIPFFQPIRDTRTDKIIKYEALFRFQEEDGTFALADTGEYLRIAKEFGRLNQIAKAMIDKTFAHASHNKDNFSLNLSGDDLSNQEILLYISQKQEQYKLPPERITFEILEGEWNDGQTNIKGIKFLKNKGFKIAMDDFGANSSNINRLIDLLDSGLIDSLKIDGKIIKGLEGEDKKTLATLDELQAKIEKLVHSHSKLMCVTGINKLDFYMLKEEITNEIAELIENNGYLAQSFELLQTSGRIEEVDIKTIEILFRDMRIQVKAKSAKLAQLAAKILSGIIESCHLSNVQIVAEFVENEKISNICNQLGIYHHQGYYIGKPGQLIK